MARAGRAGAPGGPTRHAPDGSVVSEAKPLGLVRRLRSLGLVLEGLLGLAVAGSALAFGAVHPRTYELLWGVCLFAGLVTLARAATFAQARRLLGPREVGLHSGGRWVVVSPPEGDDDALSWRVDLGEALFALGPLFRPGLAFAALVTLQLLSWPPAGERVTVSTEATLRGLAFVVALLVLHQGAAAAFADPGARRRLRHGAAWMGLLLGFIALGQLAGGAERIYGIFQPWESPTFYGSFVNRNHFAGYMLLVVPVGLGLVAEAWGQYRRRVGARPNLRRRLVGMGTTAGSRLLYALVPPFVGTAALLASISRGGILAFVGSLGLAGLALRSRRAAPAWAAGLVFVAAAGSWFGLERLEARFVHAGTDAPHRTAVWGESLELMKGTRWVSGYGFNTFAEVHGRVPAWSLPAGATPWPGGVGEALLSGERFGYRAPDDLPGLAWYREAHNDWLQLLVETGLPGLGVAVWAALAVVLAARGDPWLLAALVGPMLHALVDFDFQIPAISVLFVVLAALAAQGARAAPTGSDPGTSPS